MSILPSLKYIVISGFLLMLSVGFVRTTLEVMHNSQRLGRLRLEVAELESQKNVLREDLAYQKTDEYVEQEARNKLNMIKPGETVYVLDPKLEESVGSLDGNTEVLASQSASVSSNLGGSKAENLRQWWDLFF